MILPTYRPGDQIEPARGVKKTVALPLCIIAGALIALSIPPLSWWPCAFLGIALWDLLLRNANASARFWRSFTVALVWLMPTNLWMFDMTAVGYPIQAAMFAAMYGIGALFVPGQKARRPAFIAMLVAVALVRWNHPFGGVPLSSFAMSLVDSPLAPTARIGGSLMLVFLTALAGVALSAVFEKRWLAVFTSLAVIGLCYGALSFAPTTTVERTVDIAVVQGGGPQNTRAANTRSRDVTDRHLEATQLVETPVDFVLWPENVVDTRGEFQDSQLHELIAAEARRLDTTMIVGIVESFAADGYFLNASVSVDSDGEITSRYDKLRRVPFGEYVPMRSFIERFAPEYLPSNDARAGTGPGIIDTGVGKAAIAISWEIFHDDRVYSGIRQGGEIILNPTNGSSYWLTQVQSQQIASSRLRALETNKWVLQAAPTGYSAIISPTGEVLDRTEISEARVLQTEVEMRSGRTWASQLNHWVWVGFVSVIFLFSWRSASKRREKTGIGLESLLSRNKPDTASS